MKKQLLPLMKSKALIAFLCGFLMYMIVMLPDLIASGGITYGSGDYNIQSVPFIYHIRDTLLSGEIVLWDHSSGLGGQFLSSYAFYNLFSPFTVLYLIIPRGLISYAIPYITAVKFGTGSLLAYLYIKRYVKNGHFAVIGGLVYVFSSFSGYNLVFHFTDVIMLFPLLLLAMDELCINNNKGVFVLAIALMAVTNYYFFFGQAVFCVMYYFIRCADKSFKIKSLLNVAAEAVLGCGIGMFLLLPVFISLISIEKATSLISPESMLTYDSIFDYFKIIQSGFMASDPFYYTSLFPENQSIYPFGTLGASVALYLPLFSAAGVISYIIKKRKCWQTYILILCAGIMFVPVLNQIFSLFNSSYYARWFYMPLLISAMVSVKAIEEEISFKPGIICCTGAVAVLLLFQLFADTDWVMKNSVSLASSSIPQNVLHFSVTVISLLMLVIILRIKRDKEFLPKLYIFTVVSCYMTFGVMAHYFLTGSAINKKELVQTWNINCDLPEALKNEERIALKGGTVNFNLIWGLDSCGSFNSTYDSGFTEFMGKTGLISAKNTYTDITSNNKTLTDMMSVKYYVIASDGFNKTENVLPVGRFGEYYIYENNDFIPMGFTYDSVISEETYSKIADNELKEKVYLRSLVVGNTDDFAGIGSLEVKDDVEPVTDEEYAALIERHRSECCYNLKKTGKGISAEIDMKNENIVFFSISYNDSWRAYVDGSETAVYKVNNGMIGVIVPKGAHRIELEYSVKGLVAGIIISAASVCICVLYIVINKRRKKNGC